MRWSGWLSLATVIILVVAYATWPLLGLKRIADAVEARNVRALSELIEVDELKRSLATQLVHTYLKIIGKDQHLNALSRGLAVQVGMSIADPYIREMAKAESVINLLGPAAAEPLNGWASSFGSFLSSTYRGRDVYVNVSSSSSSSSSPVGYRLHLRLSRWKWKLAGIELPAEIQLRLVQELLKKEATR